MSMFDLFLYLEKASPNKVMVGKNNLSWKPRHFNEYNINRVLDQSQSTKII